MARLYTNYLNNGREGCTWASLVATAIACSTEQWLTCRTIAEEIWPRLAPVPNTLTSQVNAALNKLIDNKLVAYRKNQGQPDGSQWEYSLTDAGVAQFGGVPAQLAGEGPHRQQAVPANAEEYPSPPQQHRPLPEGRVD